MTEPLWHAFADPVFGGAFRNLWPLFAVPALAAFISHRAALKLPRTPEAGAPAAVLAILPGVSTIAAVIPVVTTCLQIKTWRGVVLGQLTPAVAAILVGYAIVRAVLRWREVSRLFSSAAPASARLADAARRRGLRVLELPGSARECFVAGVLRPTVFLSTGALQRLGDAELAAALEHERAHVNGRDTLLLSMLAFMRDLAPWFRPTSLEAFQAAREARADRMAARREGSLNLAAALVALARPDRREPLVASALPMANPDTLRWRMQALLHDKTEPGPQRASWRAVGAGIAANAALTAWPAAQLGLLYIVCTT